MTTKQGILAACALTRSTGAIDNPYIPEGQTAPVVEALKVLKAHGFPRDVMYEILTQHVKQEDVQYCIGALNFRKKLDNGFDEGLRRKKARDMQQRVKRN